MAVPQDSLLEKASPLVMVCSSYCGKCLFQTLPMTCLWFPCGFWWGA